MSALRRAFHGAALLLLSTATFGQSPFDGTWRPDPERDGPNTKPEEYLLSAGTYECRSCTPPYKVPADGQYHPVTGNPMYDSMSVRVADDGSVYKSAKKGGNPAAEIHVTISPDGNSLFEQQRLFGMSPEPIDLTSKLTRVGTGGPSLSGKWRRIETDLTHHEEDTTLKVVNQTVSMSDRMGRSFQAKMDGTDAPYRGSRQFDTVAVKLINPRTLEESDKKGGAVVKICTWTIDPDGTTMHARFDDLHGHIQHQTGHKLP